MNVITGELINEKELERLLKEHGEDVRELFDLVEGEKEKEEAIKALRDSDRTMVDLSKDTPLTRWATKKRTENKKIKKHKKNVAKKSKKKNRR